MSNHHVGAIYQAIIEDVINASRTDFEDQGIEESVLQDMRKGWQDKLSSLRIADFPWDPKPEPVQPPTPAPSQQQHQQPAPTSQTPTAQPQYTQTQLGPQPSAQPQSGFALPSTPAANGTNSQIKQEPNVKLESSESDPRVKQEPAYHVANNPNVNARVIENLKNQFGEGANASIRQIRNINEYNQAQAHLPHMPQHPAQQQQRSVGGQPTPQSQQYHHAVQAKTQQPLAQMHTQQNAMGQHQTDGADETEHVGIVMRGDKELSRVELDGLLHSQLLSQGREMEGGGLMVPLRPSKSTGKARATVVSPESKGSFSQLDGMDDDDDEAINSDLDDTDEDKDSDDEDDEGGNVMLCVYDKVQRVKNKWKCTLKDGVLTVNGREYVFHKAQGEFEW